MIQDILSNIGNMEFLSVWVVIVFNPLPFVRATSYNRHRHKLLCSYLKWGWLWTPAN